MNKKILIGSIIAVAILIGVSFTSVVGYRSGASDVKASPLFNIRSSRAIDEENAVLSYEYMGKGEESILSIPKRDNRIELIQKVIDVIRQMDNATFNRYIVSLVPHMKKNGHSNISNEEIVNIIIELRTKQEIDRIPLINWENQQDFTTGPCTYGAWVPGCWLYWIFDITIALIKWLLPPPGEIILATIILLSVFLISVFVPDSIICNL